MTSVDMSLRERIAETSRLWGYGGDPINRRPGLWRGKVVLDIGMGGGPHALPFLLGGAAGYIGVDPLVGTSHVRDKRSDVDPSIPPFHAFPFTPADIMAAFPACRLYSSKMEDVPLTEIAGRPELVVLSAVTEHLEDLDSVLAAAHRVAASGCTIWISHANYYGWPGHHRVPQTVRQLEAMEGKDPYSVVDWQHLDPAHPIQRQQNLNRVRLADFRAVLGRYFEIKEWRVQVCALERLTLEIRRRWKHFPLEELLAGMIFVCGVRRDRPLPLAARPLYHPPPDYLSDADFTHEDMEPFRRSNSVFFHDPISVIPNAYNDHAAAFLMASLAQGEPIVLKKYPREIHGIVGSVERPVDWHGGAWVRLAQPVPYDIFRDNDAQDWEIETTGYRVRIDSIRANANAGMKS